MIKIWKWKKEDATSCRLFYIFISFLNLLRCVESSQSASPFLCLFLLSTELFTFPSRVSHNLFKAWHCLLTILLFPTLSELFRYHSTYCHALPCLFRPKELIPCSTVSWLPAQSFPSVQAIDACCRTRHPAPVEMLAAMMQIEWQGWERRPADKDVAYNHRCARYDTLMKSQTKSREKKDIIFTPHDLLAISHPQCKRAYLLI